MIKVKFEGGYPSDQEFRALAREMMKALPMLRAFEDDYEMMISVLRQVFSAGEARGHLTAGSGCMG